jgi:flagellar hook-length control protein FliK
MLTPRLIQGKDKSLTDMALGNLFASPKADAPGFTDAIQAAAKKRQASESRPDPKQHHALGRSFGPPSPKELADRHRNSPVASKAADTHRDPAEAPKKMRRPELDRAESEIHSEDHSRIHAHKKPFRPKSPAGPDAAQAPSEAPASEFENTKAKLKLQDRAASCDDHNAQPINPEEHEATLSQDAVNELTTEIDPSASTLDGAGKNLPESEWALAMAMTLMPDAMEREANPGEIEVLQGEAAAPTTEKVQEVAGEIAQPEKTDEASVMGPSVESDGKGVSSSHSGKTETVTSKNQGEPVQSLEVGSISEDGVENPATLIVNSQVAVNSKGEAKVGSNLAQTGSGSDLPEGVQASESKNTEPATTPQETAQANKGQGSSVNAEVTALAKSAHLANSNRIVGETESHTASSPGLNEFEKNRPAGEPKPAPLPHPEALRLMHAEVASGDEVRIENEEGETSFASEDGEMRPTQGSRSESALGLVPSASQNGGQGMQDGQGQQQGQSALWGHAAVTGGKWQGTSGEAGGTHFGAFSGDAPQPGTTSQARLQDIQALLKREMDAKATSLMQVGTEEIELQLSPDHLGKVRVALELREGSVSAHIHVQSEAARQAVDQGMQQLRDSLGQHGFKIENLSVSVEDRHSGLFNPDGRGGNPFYRGQNGGSGNSGSDEDFADTAPAVRYLGYNTLEITA